MGASPGGDAPGPSPDPRLVRASAMVFVDDPSAPVLDDTDLHHLVDVLRLRTNETVVACDGEGTWTLCRFRGAQRSSDGAEVLDVESEPVTEARPAPSITIGFAPVKGDRPEWVVQKLTELGVDRIVPIRSARSVVRWEGGRAARSLGRLGRVAREAAAQTRRTWLPAVEPVTPLEGLAELVGVAPVLAVPGGGPLTLDHRLVVVGPEGGWDDTELTRFGEGIGLGPTVLRSETAALVAATLSCGLRSNLVRPLA
ncbi:MAG: RsmE family RNA methyltransferase [Acidimicrobiales bacterium]